MSIPPSQDNLDQVVKRQVIARPKPTRRKRRRNWGRVLFLIFVTVFLVSVILMVLDSF